ncbi:MAG: flavodoxin [Methanomicrobiales archaeon]|nr:flavodoxin [Methanomicrobiales archaeon]MDI6877219.1 flavodoxin [Methanomicrobiales archaeon]
MNLCIIYHSYSGITRRVAEKIQAACGGDLVEVRPKEKYTTVSAYTKGCKRARNEERDPITPEVIDVSDYDRLVIGTPVWAFKATPPINAAVAALRSCEGKRAVLFATCGGMPGDTLPILARALEARRVAVSGTQVLTRRDIGDPQKLEGLIAMVQAP